MKFFKLLLLTIVLTLMGAEMMAQPVPPRCPGHRTCDGNAGGSNEDPIICHWPPNGNMANTSAIFRWEAMSGAVTYTVAILDEDGEILNTMSTTNTAVILDLPNLSLTVGSTYAVKVTSDNEKNSNIHFFTLKTEAEYMQTLIDLESDADYQMKSGVDKELRKSDFLHEKGWNLGAIQAHNIQTDNVTDIIKISDHFETLRLILYPG